MTCDFKPISKEFANKHRCIECPESKLCDRYHERPQWNSCIEKIKAQPVKS